MRSKWKKLLVLLVAVLGLCALSSWAFNFPLRFRHVRQYAPRSQDPVRASTTAPDNIVLTPAGDLATAIRVTWRTSADVPDGAVQFTDGEVGASARTLHSPELTSDDTVKYFTATLDRLTPGTTYRYRTGSPSLNVWSDYAEFTTAPAEEEGFSFVFFGDTQRRAEDFGAMLDGARERHPDTVLYLMGGDIVDAGENRNLWDQFMEVTGPTYSRTPIAPALGNHDYSKGGDGVEFFVKSFGLPTPPGKPWTIGSYSFRRGGAFFAVINTPDAEDEADWLEAELKSARADGCDFITVMFHEPVYHPKDRRSNRGAARYLVPLFDQYGVDLVFNCHDHSYLRSKPLRAGRAVPAGDFGTVYIVGNSCDKFYEAIPLEVAETQLENVTTYQRITFGRSADGRPLLRYAAHTEDGKVVDSFETTK